MAFRGSQVQFLSGPPVLSGLRRFFRNRVVVEQGVQGRDSAGVSPVALFDLGIIVVDSGCTQRAKTIKEK